MTRLLKESWMACEGNRFSNIVLQTPFPVCVVLALLAVVAVLAFLKFWNRETDYLHFNLFCLGCQYPRYMIS